MSTDGAAPTGGQASTAPAAGGQQPAQQGLSGQGPSSASADSSGPATSQVGAPGSVQGYGAGSGDGAGADYDEDSNDGHGSTRSQASSFALELVARPQKIRSIKQRFPVFPDADYEEDALANLKREGATIAMREELQDAAVGMFVSRGEDAHMVRQMRELLGSVQSFAGAWKDRTTRAVDALAHNQAFSPPADVRKSWNKMTRDVYQAQEDLAHYEHTSSNTARLLMQHIEAEIGLVISSLQATALTDVNLDKELYVTWNNDQVTESASRVSNTLRDWLLQAQSFQLQANKLLSSLEGTSLHSSAPVTLRAPRVTFAAGTGDTSASAAAISGADPGRENEFIKVTPAICSKYERPAGAPLITDRKVKPTAMLICTPNEASSYLRTVESYARKRNWTDVEMVAFAFACLVTGDGNKDILVALNDLAMAEYQATMENLEEWAHFKSVCHKHFARPSAKLAATAKWDAFRSSEGASPAKILRELTEAAADYEIVTGKTIPASGAITKYRSELLSKHLKIVHGLRQYGQFDNETDLKKLADTAEYNHSNNLILDQGVPGATKPTANAAGARGDSGGGGGSGSGGKSRAKDGSMKRGETAFGVELMQLARDCANGAIREKDVARLTAFCHDEQHVSEKDRQRHKGMCIYCELPYVKPAHPKKCDHERYYIGCQQMLAQRRKDGDHGGSGSAHGAGGGGGSAGGSSGQSGGSGGGGGRKRKPDSERDWPTQKKPPHYAPQARGYRKGDPDDHEDRCYAWERGRCDDDKCPYVHDARTKGSRAQGKKEEEQRKSRARSRSPEARTQRKPARSSARSESSGH